MNAPTLDSRVRRAADVVFHELEGEAVIVNLNRGTCFTLDPVGTRIWELLGEEDRLHEIVRMLIAEFDVDEQTAAGDLLQVVGALLARELVTAG